MVVRRNLEPASDRFSQARLSRKLLGHIQITEVQRRSVQSRSRQVLLHNMSTDELEFSTTLCFPVYDGYQLSIILQLNRKTFQLTGTVLSRVKTGNLYHYDLRITERSVTRSEWIRELNEWLLLILRNRPEHRVHQSYRTQTQ